MLDQVAILANKNSSESLAVARYYAQRRGIPANHVIQLDLPLTESISRETYDTRVVQPTRHALQERGLVEKIRVLVTTYGIPLRIDAPQASDQRRAWLDDARERQKTARERIRLLEEWVRALAPVDNPASSPQAELSQNQEQPGIVRPSVGDPQVERVGLAFREAAARIRQVRDRQNLEKAVQDLSRFTVQFGGIAALAQNLRPAPGTGNPQGIVEREKLLAQAASVQAMIQVLTQTPSELNRQRAYFLAERMFGLQGVLSLAKAEEEIFSYRDGDASLDSELSLLWGDEESYHIAGRMANPLYVEEGSEPNERHRTLMPVMMVSRLDAPTHQLAMRLVDQAISAEQSGLQGRVYVDARGLATGPPLSYGSYDQSLRDLAEMFRQLASRSPISYQVILENTERRFSQPGEAPDVAVYVGWYRLRSYEDAFTFRPGAIGYHLASAEAASIHDPDEPGWCKNALERGITVTLGSTGEPLLDAFPEPYHFFRLLLTGQYSLVEAYYLTSRYVSWRMVLFGDPLYTPWRGRGVHDGKALPVAPSDRPFHNPLQAVRQVKHLRETALSRIDQIMSQLEHAAQEPSRGPHH